MPSDATASSVTLPTDCYYIRDALIRHSRYPHQAVTCHIRGLLLRTWDRQKDYVWGSIRDVTGQLPFYAKRETLEAGWAELQSIANHTPSTLTGEIFKSEQGKSAIRVQKFSVISKPFANTPAEIEWLSDNVFTGQFFMARLRRRTADWFTAHNFDEFDPRQILPSIGPPFPGIDPLGVNYPGFGPPARLTTSPIPQLFEACLVAGRERVFGTSRCFSQANRDGYTSAEAVVICAVMLNVDFKQLTGIAESAVKHTLNDQTTLPADFQDFLAEPAWQRATRSFSDTRLDYKKPIIEQFQKDNLELFRVLYPPEISLAEGHTEKSKDFTASFLTIHIERMVRLIRDIRLGDLRPATRVKKL